MHKTWALGGSHLGAEHSSEVSPGDERLGIVHPLLPPQVGPTPILPAALCGLTSLASRIARQRSRDLGGA